MNIFILILSYWGSERVDVSKVPGIMILYTNINPLLPELFSRRRMLKTIIAR